MTAPITTRRLIVLGAIFALALAAFVLLLAFTPARLMGGETAGSAQGRAATGFAGLQRLLPPAEDGDPIDSEELLIVILPPHGLDADTRDLLHERRTGKATLLVLPKWNVVAEPMQPGRVRSAGLQRPAFPGEPGVTVEQDEAPAKGMLKGRDYMEGWDMQPALKSQQWLEGDNVIPLLVTAEGRAVLAEIGNADEDKILLVLADPDLLNNLAMADRKRAGAAVGLVAALNSTGSESASVIDAAELAAGRNLLRLLLTPPFLAMTLVLLALLLFGGWQALIRFGAPVVPPPAILPGKEALVENAAGLLRMAGREALAAPPYARLIARQAAEESGIPPMEDARLWPLLDRIGDGRFTELATDMTNAGRAEMPGAAQALYEWKEGLKQ
ncbi:hypothetical protein FJQ54_03585 [Sandaracinobacter neustonicus]|uniref:DUF4350 domain-containing protein n=1 Tax=Sandaracinobacter neustonicus TaxID=1715348 RepID=A0A501XV01_9SPHN|nr:hypothetical protein [Sandaracinobacter neustonicus]TPE63934.1 hypothetical protein FJQ54_03585 [Sandaracinobacter neustonicus]